MPKIRNVAIIAHVDHGKTTLVDGLLKQSHIFRENQHVGNLLMDSNELERERGITILAKNTAINYHDVKINIIDTPGHADFGGEVERVLNMADGCLLLVDAVEGPMPQTRFVLQEALALGLRPILVINKIDRPNARPQAVLEETQDLFLELATDPEQLDFPVLYAIAKEGIATTDPNVSGKDLQPLFEAILNHIPAPSIKEGPFQMLVANLDYDDYRGRFAIGRIHRGAVKPGDTIMRIDRDGRQIRAKVGQVFTYYGLGRLEVEEAVAGDIVALTGVENVAISDTLADPIQPEALPVISIEEPTVKMSFGVNTGPFGGKEGKFSTGRQIRARLMKELETNIALRVFETDSDTDFLVAGRGELHLSILIETMRREGYEFQVGRPEVITRTINGVLSEPVEELVIDSSAEYLGALQDQLSRRLGTLVDIYQDEQERVRLTYRIPTRGLIGFRSWFLTSTRGDGLMSSRLLGYEPWMGSINTVRSGSLVAHETGVATTFGLQNAQGRGVTFIEPGTMVYEGMIVGMNSREEDLVVNVAKQKKLTNIRQSTQEIMVRLTPSEKMSLEQALDFIADDELVEVTPQNIRLRKRWLTAEERSKQRAREAATA